MCRNIGVKIYTKKNTNYGLLSRPSPKLSDDCLKGPRFESRQQLLESRCSDTSVKKVSNNSKRKKKRKEKEYVCDFVNLQTQYQEETVMSNFSCHPRERALPSSLSKTRKPPFSPSKCIPELWLLIFSSSFACITAFELCGVPENPWLSILFFHVSLFSNLKQLSPSLS